MSILIFGAGKIARGFIGHLLWKSKLPFSFVEYNKEIVDLLNEQRSYKVRLLGETIKEETVTGFSVYPSQDVPLITKIISEDMNLLIISVGGKNLAAILPVIRNGIYGRFKKNNKTILNIILCENWLNPADIIRDGLYKDTETEFKQFLDSCIGVTESVIMRSAIEPDEQVLLKDKTAVNVQDYWHWPINKKYIKGELPHIIAMEPQDDFNSFLDKKFYTYNAANGSVSYLGHLKKYTYISQAAHDPEILEILMKVYQETGLALCNKYGFTMADQMAFAQTSLNKLQNKYLVDYIERNARDPLRKLGPNDRLIGPAKMVVEYGGKPEGLATAIAAALYYFQPSDPFAEELRNIREKYGIVYILDAVCKLESKDSLLRRLIIEKIDELKKRGWISE